MLRESIAIRRKMLPPGHYAIAHVTSLLAECFRRGQRFEEGDSLAVDSYLVYRREFGDDDERTQTIHDRLVAFYRDWGKPLPDSLEAGAS